MLNGHLILMVSLSRYRLTIVEIDQMTKYGTFFDRSAGGKRYKFYFEAWSFFFRGAPVGPQISYS